MSVWQLTRRSTRGEQPDEGVEVDEKNDQIALRRMRSRTGNPQE